MSSVMDIVTGGCNFPLCRFNRDKGSEFCLHHRKHFGESTKKIKKPIAFESKKRAKERIVRKKMLVKKVEEDPWCRIKSPVCSGLAEGGNHIQKSSLANYSVAENNDPCCFACNGYIETHVQWAIDNGHQVSRFKKSSLK